MKTKVGIFLMALAPGLLAGGNVEQYGLYEWSMPTGEVKGNPYDIRDNEFSARITKPDGGEVKVPGFYFRDYAMDGAGKLKSEGEARWVLRYTPVEAGDYTFKAQLIAGEKTSVSGDYQFSAAPAGKTGFVRTSRVNPKFFSLDGGGAYFPVGMSVSWTKREKQMELFEAWFDKLAKSGSNFTRIWNCEWSLPLEWVDHENTQGQCHGVGRYSQDNSWRLDRIFEMARDRDIRILLTLGTYGELMIKKGPWNENHWPRNPYNIVNGGPCKKPRDFFSNPEAIRLFKQRLRYIVARWGYSPHLFALELWNEYKAPHKWVEEMAAYARELDPNRHLVANSVAFPWGKPYSEKKLWRLENMGYTQEHYYGYGSGGDMAEYVFATSKKMAENYAKPFFFEEIGLDSSKNDAEYDTEGAGTHVHNFTWASLVGFSGGMPMLHWKEYVDERDLYRELAAARSFADAVDRGARQWKTIEMEADIGSKGEGGDLVVACGGNWGEAGGEKMVVHSSGKVEGRPNQFLRTTARDGKQASWKLDVPEGGKMILRVKQVSTAADLRVRVDGKEVWRHLFDASPGIAGDGEYKKTTIQPQYDGIYFADYDKDYTVKLPPGRHEVVLDNCGQDWIKLESVTFTGYQRGSRVKLYGMVSDDVVLAWMQDKKNLWSNVYKDKIKPALRQGLVFDVPVKSEGAYELEWWDTYTGRVMAKQDVESVDGRVKLELPAFKRDIACILRLKGDARK